jgi:hypothetical protein
MHGFDADMGLDMEVLAFIISAETVEIIKMASVDYPG